MATPVPLSAAHKRPHIWAFSAPRTVDEQAVINASVALREKDDWRSKALDDGIMARWKAEAKEAHDFSDSMLRYLEDELKHEAARWHDEACGIESSGIHGVVRSDRLVPDALLRRLRTLSARLEDVPEYEKDWHPESNNTVLDVVHPSLYCLVDGITRVLPRQEAVHFAADGSRSLAPWFAARPDVYESLPERQIDRNVDSSPPLKHTCQWLPSDFAVDASGKVKTLSYINNLHPAPNSTSGQLYDIIEQVLEAFVPLFEASLAEYQLPAYSKAFRAGHDEPYWLTESWNPPEPEELTVEQLASNEDDAKYLLENGDQTWDTSERRIEEARREYWIENREWARIPIEKYEPQEIQPISLKDRTLQIIVKMATIHLTPDKPAYDGGAWHVEGTHREKICATGILYFDQQNIEGSKLGFRAAISSEAAESTIPYEQNEHDSIVEFYGFSAETETSQVLGSLSTRPGRALAFPNGLQHQVAPFELADKSKPGYRKILAFFLVDPVDQVIGTAWVPPQQFGWMRERIATLLRALPPRVPMEVRQLIAEYAAPAAIVPKPRDRSALVTVRKRARLTKVVLPSDSARNAPPATTTAATTPGDSNSATTADGTQTQGFQEDPRTLPLSPAALAERAGGGFVGMRLAEARDYRLVLMRERAMQAVAIEDANEAGFSFCEH